MQEDTHEFDGVALPRFVRQIGVLDTTGGRRESATSMGVLSPFEGVLQLGMGRSGGLPPGLTYLALPDIVATSLPDGEPGPGHAGRPGTGRENSTRSIGDDGSGTGSTPADGDGTPPKVSEVLRGTPDGESSAARTDWSGNLEWADRPAGDTPGGVDRPAGRGSGAFDRQGGGDRSSDADGESGPIRELRRLEGSPAILGGARPGEGGHSRPAGSPPTVLATAPIPRPGVGAHEPDVARGDEESSPVGQATTPGRQDRFDRSATPTGDGPDGLPTPADDSGAAFAEPPLEWRRADRPADAVPGSGGRKSGGEGGSTPTRETGDRVDPGTGPRLTVLEGSPRGESTDGTRGGGSPTTGGDGTRGTGGQAGSADPRPASPGDGSAGTSTERATGGDPDASDWPFPRDLSLDGGGPDARFLEEVYRELTRKMDIERDRRGF